MGHKKRESLPAFFEPPKGWIHLGSVEGGVNPNTVSKTLNNLCYGRIRNPPKILLPEMLSVSNQLVELKFSWRTTFFEQWKTWTEHLIFIFLSLKHFQNSPHFGPPNGSTF